MKRSIFSVFLTFIMILLLGYCLVSIYRLHSTVATLKMENEELRNDLPEEEIEVAEVMADFQRFAGKLEQSILSGNQELAAFYIHELEEAGEVFEENEVIDEEINLSRLYKTLLRPNVTALKEVIDQKDLVAADKAMKVIWNSCNTCHGSSNHSFIVVQPQKAGEGFFNQEFSTAK